MFLAWSVVLQECWNWVSYTVLIVGIEWYKIWYLLQLNLCLNFTPFCPTDVPEPSSGSVSVVSLNETGKVRVTWSERILGPGQVITGYSVQYRRKGAASYTTRSVSGSSTTSYTITNLNLGTVYEVRVASVGPLGLSRYCCGSGKQVTTYNSECKAHKVHVVQIDCLLIPV